MPMEASMNIGIRPVNRPQSASGTEGVSRREDGGSSAAFSPKTNVSIQNAVDDMAGILSKISSNQAEAVDKMPQELQKIIQNVLKQAFSLEETMGQGLGSTLESQRFSMDQLSALSRMLSQLGNVAEKGMAIEVSDEMRALLTNLKSMVSSENGSSLEPVLLTKAAFELLDNKDVQQLPKEVQALLLALQPQGQASAVLGDSSSSMGFLKQLVQYFMPRSSSAEGTVEQNQNSTQMSQSNAQAEQTAQNTPQSPQSAGQMQGQANGNGQTAAQPQQNQSSAQMSPSGAQAGQTAQNTPQSPQSTGQTQGQANGNGQTAAQAQQNRSSAQMSQSGAQTGQTAQNTPQSPQSAGQSQGQANGNGQTAAQPQQNQSSAQMSQLGAQAGQTAQNTPQSPQSTSQMQGQAQNTLQNPQESPQDAGQPQRQANGSEQQATAQAKSAPQQAAMQQAKAQLMRQTMENTQQTMQTMKSLAQMLLVKNTEMSQHDAALLQNFVNGQSGTLSEKEAKQLQQLTRLCQQNVPATVQQAAIQENLPDLPRLWAFMQLCDMAFARRMTARQLKRAGKDVAMLVLSMRNSMEGDNSAVQGQRSLNFMVPLYMGEESTYPSYINVYNEKQPDPETGEMKKETWLRLCVLTDNIGAVELTCRVYNDTQLDMRVFFSSSETAEEFRQQAKALRDSLKDSALQLHDLKIGAAGE